MTYTICKGVDRVRGYRQLLRVLATGRGHSFLFGLFMTAPVPAVFFVCKVGCLIRRWEST